MFAEHGMECARGWGNFLVVGGFRVEWMRRVGSDASLRDVIVISLRTISFHHLIKVYFSTIQSVYILRHDRPLIHSWAGFGGGPITH